MQTKNEIIDSKLLTCAILLLSIGIIMVYSASIAYASTAKNIHNQYYYLFRHIGYVAIGVIAGIITFTLPTELLKKHAKKIAIVIAILLLAVLIPKVGKVINGSRRWIGVGLLNIQPSEFAKLGIAIYLANYVCYRDLKNFFKDLLPALLVMFICIGLLLLEPDMGSATVVFIIGLSILFMANINKNYILSLILIGVVGFITAIITEPYRMRRVLGFMDPWQDALGKGYQLTHSLLAIGHGKWFGVGLGNSIEKLFYLPEAHTDFILAIIAEETGILGIGIIILLFTIIFYRGFNIIALQCLPNRVFQALVAQGISVWFLAQTLVNIGVIIGILPTKGLTLPFISYGGSSILVSCIAIAILLRIDYENKTNNCN